MKANETVSLRMPAALLAEAEAIMAARGIMKISDFIRQAMASEINNQRAQPAAQFARRGRKTLEAKK